MPKTDPDLKQLNADPEQATGDTNPGRQTDRQAHKHPPMNTQEVTDSHTLKVTQTHKNTTYGVQRERQLYSDTHRQTDRCEQAHGVTTTHTGSHGHGGSDTQRQAQSPSKSPQQRQSETEGQKVGGYPCKVDRLTDSTPV